MANDHKQDHHPGDGWSTFGRVVSAVGGIASAVAAILKFFNDPQWYTHDKQVYIPKLSFGINKGAVVANTQPIPYAMVMHVAEVSPADTTPWHANVASVFSAISSTNTNNVPYTIDDVYKYSMSVRAGVVILGWLTMLIKASNSGLPAVPGGSEPIVKAVSNLTVSDIVTNKLHLLQVRKQLQACMQKFPYDCELMKRSYKTYANVLSDAESPEPQFYFFKPAEVGACFGDTTVDYVDAAFAVSSADYIQDLFSATSSTDVCTIILGYINDMFAQNNYLRIATDYINTFGSWTLEDLNPDDPIGCFYDENALTMLTNAMTTMAPYTIISSGWSKSPLSATFEGGQLVGAPGEQYTYVDSHSGAETLKVAILDPFIGYVGTTDVSNNVGTAIPVASQDFPITTSELGTLQYTAAAPIVSSRRALDEGSSVEITRLMNRGYEFSFSHVTIELSPTSFKHVIKIFSKPTVYGSEILLGVEVFRSLLGNVSSIATRTATDKIGSMYNVSVFDWHPRWYHYAYLDGEPLVSATLDWDTDMLGQPSDVLIQQYQYVAEDSLTMLLPWINQGTKAAAQLEQQKKMKR